MDPSFLEFVEELPEADSPQQILKDFFFALGTATKLEDVNVAAWWARERLGNGVAGE
jgi:hypothetical protein